MATPLKLRDGNGNIQEFTTSEENYIAYQIGLHLSNADSAEVGSLNRATTGTTVGTFSNTFFNQPVGTHPSTSITTGTTNTTIYQTNGTAAETDSDVLSPLMWVDSGGQTGFKQMPDLDLNEAVDRYLSTIFTSEYPGAYRIASSSPGADWSTQQAAFTDTRTDGTSVTYNIYKRSSYSAPTAVRPMYVEDSAGGTGIKIQPMSDRKIKYSFGQRAKTRIMNSKIGTHQLRSATAGAPTDPGTWVARGTATDTKQTTSQQLFTRDSTVNFQANYTRAYTSVYATNYTKLRQINYQSLSEVNYTTLYSKSFTRLASESFAVPYTRDYQRQYERSYVRTYTGLYNQGYLGTFTGLYTQTYLTRYDIDYIANYNRSYTDSYNTVYTSNYLQNYQTNFVNNSNTGYQNLYTPNYTRAYTGNFNLPYQRDYSITYVSPIYQSTYVGQPLIGYDRNFLNLDDTTYTNFAQVGYQITYVPNYTTVFVSPTYESFYTNNYTSNYIGNYIKRYTGNYVRLTRTTAYQRNYTGNYIGSYIGNYIPNYTRNFPYTGGYLRSIDVGYVRAVFYTTNYIRNYVGNYESAVYINGESQPGENNVYIPGAGDFYYIGPVLPSPTPQGHQRGFNNALLYYTGLSTYVRANTAVTNASYEGRRTAYFAPSPSGPEYETTVVTPTITRPYLNETIIYTGAPAPQYYIRNFAGATVFFNGSAGTAVYSRNYTASIAPAPFSINYGGTTIPYARDDNTGFAQGYLNFITYVTTINNYYERTFARVQGFQRQTAPTGYAVSYTPPAFIRNTAVNYTRDFNTDFQNLRDVDYTRVDVNTFANQYIKTFTGYYTRQFVLNAGYATNYVRNFPIYYIRRYTGNYQQTYSSPNPVPQSYDGLGFAAPYTRTFAATYTNTYTGPAFNTPYIGAAFAANYTRAYEGNYLRDYSITYTNNFATNYEGNPYTKSYLPLGVYPLGGQAGYIGNYSGGYDRQIAEYYSSTFYTATYTHTSDVPYTDAYIANYLITYIGAYTGIYTSVYTGAYDQTYVGTYTGDYTTDYIGNYENVYTRNFEAQYLQDYLGNFIGNFEGETIDATSETNETYTLYVRIA